MKRCGYKQREAAVLLGLHESFMSMLVNRRRVPTLNNAIKIERLSGIPVEAWSSSASDKSAKASHRKRRQAERSQTVNADA